MKLEVDKFVYEEKDFKDCGIYDILSMELDDLPQPKKVVMTDEGLGVSGKHGAIVYDENDLKRIHGSLRDSLIASAKKLKIEAEYIRNKAEAIVRLADRLHLEGKI